MMFWKGQSYGDREQSSGYWAAGRVRVPGGRRANGGAVMDLLFILIMVAIIQLSPFVKTHKNV